MAKLAEVGGRLSNPALQAQVITIPALPVQAAANLPAKKSGTSWFTWLLIGGAIIGLAMWFTCRTVWRR